MSLPRKSHIITVFSLFVVLTSIAALPAQQTEDEVPFRYPDPRTVGTRPYIMQGKPAGAVSGDRYAGMSEWEQILLRRQMQEIGTVPGQEQPPCPLCADSPAPCKTCKMCLAGFPCEKTLCQHCVQPRSKNMGSSCDLSAGDEPCGTCDACREHRSDPCGHADNGFGPRGEFNPYHETSLLAVIPRPILDIYNGGARKFPVYYNPAPYYQPTWNPSSFMAHTRPFTFRYSCGLCFRDPCGCDKPGMAGQVSYIYACKVCNRNPCACTQEICDVTKPLDPVGIALALAEMNAERERSLPGAVLEPPPSTTPTTPAAPAGTSTGGEGIRVDTLFDDDSPIVPETDEPAIPVRSLL